MSPWDGVLFVAIILAVWRGYRRGFFRRMMGWVGVLFTLYGSVRIKSFILPQINSLIDGKAWTARAIEHFLLVRYGTENLSTNAEVETWLDAHRIFAPFKEGVMTQMLVTHRDTSPLHALAQTLAVPIWHWLAIALSWFVLFVIIWVVAASIGKIIRKVMPLRVIDAFVGATVSCIMAFVCMGLLTKGVLFFTPESLLGHWVEQSFFVPLLDTMAKGLVQSLLHMPIQ